MHLQQKCFSVEKTKDSYLHKKVGKSFYFENNILIPPHITNNAQIKINISYPE